MSREHIFTHIFFTSFALRFIGPPGRATEVAPVGFPPGVGLRRRRNRRACADAGIARVGGRPAV